MKEQWQELASCFNGLIDWTKDNQLPLTEEAAGLLTEARKIAALIEIILKENGKFELATVEKYHEWQLKALQLAFTVEKLRNDPTKKNSNLLIYNIGKRCYQFHNNYIDNDKNVAKAYAEEAIKILDYSIKNELQGNPNKLIHAHALIGLAWLYLHKMETSNIIFLEKCLWRFEKVISLYQESAHPIEEVNIKAIYWNFILLHVSRNPKEERAINCAKNYYALDKEDFKARATQCGTKKIKDFYNEIEKLVGPQEKQLVKEIKQQVDKKDKKSKNRKRNEQAKKAKEKRNVTEEVITNIVLQDTVKIDQVNAESTSLTALEDEAVNLTERISGNKPFENKCNFFTSAESFKHDFYFNKEHPLHIHECDAVNYLNEARFFNACKRFFGIAKFLEETDSKNAKKFYILAKSAFENGKERLSASKKLEQTDNLDRLKEVLARKLDQFFDGNQISHENNSGESSKLLIR